MFIGAAVSFGYSSRFVNVLRCEHYFNDHCCAVIVLTSLLSSKHRLAPRTWCFCIASPRFGSHRFLCARQVRRHGVAAWRVVREALPVISRSFWPGVSCGSVAPNETRIQSFFADDGVTETGGWFETRALSLNVSCA